MKRFTGQEIDSTMRHDQRDNPRIARSTVGAEKCDMTTKVFEYSLPFTKARRQNYPFGHLHLTIS
jgi:hypothetical protein